MPHVEARLTVREASSFATILRMLFMIIEHFKGNAEAVGARFKAKGRMLPEGVTYQASWVETSGARCFQIIEAPSMDAITPGPASPG